MARKNQDQDADAFAGGELVDISHTDGRKLQVSRKAFESIYKNGGFSDGSAKTAPVETAEDDDLSPQQKAARTKAAKAAAEASAQSESE